MDGCGMPTLDTAYCLESEGKWFEFDDSYVGPISSDDVVVSFPLCFTCFASGVVTASFLLICPLMHIRLVRATSCFIDAEKALNITLLVVSL